MLAAQASHAASARHGVINTLIQVLEPLLPNVETQKLRSFANGVLDESISLKAAMVEEQAIYRSYFSVSGAQFDAEWMEIPEGEHPSGRVAMCMFPGLRRFTTKDGSREFIPVVKSRVKLGR